MNDFFKLPVALTEALSKNDMMLVVGGDRAVKITVVNEGHGCNVAGALNRNRLRLLICFYPKADEKLQMHTYLSFLSAYY